MITLAVFAFFAALAAVSAVLVVVQKNAMHSVLYLAFTVLSTAGVFFTLRAEYLGAIQILVYGGGIVVLYVFVIIIVNLNEIVPERRGLFPKIFIFAVPLLLLAELGAVLFKSEIAPLMPLTSSSSSSGMMMGSMKDFSETLFKDYLVPFELASILLLAVLVGAVIVARRKLLHDPD
jgi:NADH-quinone oxidoreductase subunit J